MYVTCSIYWVRFTRKPCCRMETARYRCKFRCVQFTGFSARCNVIRTWQYLCCSKTTQNQYLLSWYFTVCLAALYVADLYIVFVRYELTNPTTWPLLTANCSWVRRAVLIAMPMEYAIRDHEVIFIVERWTYVSTDHQRHRQTDRRMDGRTDGRLAVVTSCNDILQNWLKSWKPI